MDAVRAALRLGAEGSSLFIEDQNKKCHARAEEVKFAKAEGV